MKNENPVNKMTRSQAQKVARERNLLRAKHKKLSDKLWKTSVSSVSFKLLQDKIKQIETELENRNVEFKSAFLHNFCPAVPLE